MFWVLILFLFLCFGFLKINKNKIIKKNKKYKLKIIYKKYCAKKMCLKNKFLFFEDICLKDAKIVDQILERIDTNCPKLAKNPVFLHNYSKKTIALAKKYRDFEDIDISRLDDKQLQTLQQYNVNFEPSPPINLPKQKLDFFGDFCKKSFDFGKYKLNIYKNSKLEIAHYDFGQRDFLKIICFFPTRLQFVYFDGLEKFDGQILDIFKMQNCIKLANQNDCVFFEFSQSPQYLHFSKNKAQRSKKNCILAYFDFFVQKSMQMQFCLSKNVQGFLDLEQLKSQNQECICLDKIMQQLH